MKEDIIKIVQSYVDCAEKCMIQSEEGYEDGNVDDTAQYYYWDGAHDIALAIEREIKNL